jgi:hypothetical protein
VTYVTPQSAEASCGVITDTVVRSAKSTLRGIRFESLYKKPAYNTVSDFTPVSLVVEAPRTLITPKTFPSDGMHPSEQAEQRWTE